MVINTESTVGYNNKLKQAVPGLKLGVNNEVNPDTKKAGLKLMAGSPSKINPPNSHPSNPIHKAATKKPALIKIEPTTLDKTQPTTSDQDPAVPQHEINKAAVIVGVVGVAALLLTA